jgi:hypothetical protein
MCSVRADFVAPRAGNGAVRIWPNAGNPGYPALLIVTSDVVFTIVTTWRVMRKTSRKG